MATVDAADRGREAAPGRPPLPAFPFPYPPDPSRPGGGHTMPIGRTGAGESALVAFMAEEMRRRRAPSAPTPAAGGPGDGR